SSTTEKSSSATSSISRPPTPVLTPRTRSLRRSAPMVSRFLPHRRRMAAARFKAAPAAAPAQGDEEGEPKDPGEAAAESDFDDDDMENSLSLAAIEAELKPK